MDNKTKVRESTAAKIDRSPKVKLRTVWGELYSEVFTMGRFRTLSVVDDDLFCGKSEEEIKEIGRLEGILEERVDMIKNMYKAGADVHTIHKFTGFDTAFIQSVFV